jgi:hypothetical protein
VNVVCITGRLGGTIKSGIPLQEGWSTRVLRVPREGLDGEEDAGVFGVVLLLPHWLAAEARQQATGSWMAVVGALIADVDYSDATPRFHHALVVRSLEPAPEPAATSG